MCARRECLWRFGRGVHDGRHAGADGDHAGGQQDDDEHDDQDDDDDDHDQLDVLPPVGAGHFLRRLLEVLRLRRHTGDHMTALRRPRLPGRQTSTRIAEALSGNSTPP